MSDFDERVHTLATNLAVDSFNLGVKHERDRIVELLKAHAEMAKAKFTPLDALTLERIASLINGDFN